MNLMAPQDERDTLRLSSGIARRAWAEAVALVGTRYRLHGRSAEHGLDCVGLVALAYARAGLRFAPPPDDYRLRGDAMGRAAGLLEQSGFARIDGGKWLCGDVLLIHVGAGQQHLILGSPHAHIHAHAGLRRVVMTPGAPAGQVLGHWRFAKTY
ncbi:MAG: NlpC/P60 family protein [Pseudomonadota bacterium]